MTAEQFLALSKLLRLRSADPSRQAAFLQLVENMRPSEAAAKAGISPNAASKAATRARRGLQLAFKATKEEA